MIKFLYIVFALSFIMVGLSSIRLIILFKGQEFVEAFLQLVGTLFFVVITAIIFLIIKKKEK